LIENGKKNEENEKMSLLKRIIVSIILVGFIGLTILFMFYFRFGMYGQKFLSASGKIAPFLDEETGYWTFQTDDDFVILQLTDTHLTGSILMKSGDDKSLLAIKTMVERVNPDLVIITGDVGNGKDILSKTIPEQTDIVAELMNSMNVYWTVSLGNHDQPNDTVKQELVNTYQKYAPLCLFQRGPEDIYGVGNTVINIKNSKGKITESLVLVDSNSNRNILEYDNIHQDQIDWYEREILRLNDLNKDKVDSLMFIHIPFEEYKIAYEIYEKNDHKDTDEVQWLGGTHGESVSNSPYSDEMFETILKLNSTRAVFCGHDHFNNYGIKYKGVDLIYAMSIDYNAYAGCCTEQRGGTIITVHPDGTYGRENSRYQ
jgi:predicted MPP superfamily phosphohydrolase